MGLSKKDKLACLLYGFRGLSVTQNSQILRETMEFNPSVSIGTLIHRLYPGVALFAALRCFCAVFLTFMLSVPPGMEGFCLRG